MTSNKKYVDITCIYVDRTDTTLATEKKTVKWTVCNEYRDNHLQKLNSGKYMSYWSGHRLDLTSLTKFTPEVLTNFIKISNYLEQKALYKQMIKKAYKKANAAMAQTTAGLNIYIDYSVQNHVATAFMYYQDVFVNVLKQHLPAEQISAPQLHNETCLEGIIELATFLEEISVTAFITEHKINHTS